VVKSVSIPWSMLQPWGRNASFHTFHSRRSNNSSRYRRLADHGSKGDIYTLHVSAQRTEGDLSKPSCPTHNQDATNIALAWPIMALSVLLYNTFWRPLGYTYVQSRDAFATVQT